MDGHEFPPLNTGCAAAKSGVVKNIQVQNKCVCIGAITGPRFLSPARHLLAVALTRQSPAANAM